MTRGAPKAVTNYVKAHSIKGPNAVQHNRQVMRDAWAHYRGQSSGGGRPQASNPGLSLGNQSDLVKIALVIGGAFLVMQAVGKGGPGGGQVNNNPETAGQFNSASISVR